MPARIWIAYVLIAVVVAVIAAGAVAWRRRARFERDRRRGRLKH